MFSNHFNICYRIL